MEEIEEHFEYLRKKRIEESLKLEAQTANKNELSVTYNPRLRYNEKLQLNKFGATAAFKSMTRTKRNHVPDGQGIVRDEVPDMGKYPVKFDLVRP